MEIIESRDFKVPQGRIRRWADNVGVPRELDLIMTQRAENSISDEMGGSNSESSEGNTLDSGRQNK